MRRLLFLRVADFRAFGGERDDSRVQQDKFFPQRIQLGLLPEDNLAELLEVVLQMSHQQFDVGDSVVSVGNGHGISNFRSLKRG